MALTPEDVVNKRFNPTKFREGYDQDEVDDFLDEVVVELRRLTQENEELRQRLVAADGRINELQRAASQAPVAQPSVAPVVAPAPMAAPAPVPAPVTADYSAPEYSAQDAGSIDQSNTNNLLQLARRLHEEHVREGMEKRDQLIAEGHATAARLVSDAEAQERAAVEALAAEKAQLEIAVEELRVFESSYRDQLKSYIESQLRELEANSPVAASEAPAQPAVEAAAPAFDPSAPAFGGQPSFDAAPAPSFDAAPAPTFDAAPAPAFDAAPAPSFEQTPAPDYAAPADYANPFADLTQAPAPIPGQAPIPGGSTPPAYAGYPAPQFVNNDYGQGSQAPVTDPSQQPEYPTFSQRPQTEYPGVGGN